MCKTSPVAKTLVGCQPMILWSVELNNCTTHVSSAVDNLIKFESMTCSSLLKGQLCKYGETFSWELNKFIKFQQRQKNLVRIELITCSASLWPRYFWNYILLQKSFGFPRSNIALHLSYKSSFSYSKNTKISLYILVCFRNNIFWTFINIKDSSCVRVM